MGVECRHLVGDLRVVPEVVLFAQRDQRVPAGLDGSLEVSGDTVTHIVGKSDKLHLPRRTGSVEQLHFAADHVHRGIRRRIV